MYIYTKRKISKIPLKMDTTKISWEIIALTGYKPLRPCYILCKCHQGMLDAANQLFPLMLLKAGEDSYTKSNRKITRRCRAFNTRNTDK